METDVWEIESDKHATLTHIYYYFRNLNVWKITHNLIQVAWVDNLKSSSSMGLWHVSHKASVTETVSPCVHRLPIYCQLSVTGVTGLVKAEQCRQNIHNTPTSSPQPVNTHCCSIIGYVSQYITGRHCLQCNILLSKLVLPTKFQLNKELSVSVLHIFFA